MLMNISIDTNYSFKFTIFLCNNIVSYVMFKILNPKKMFKSEFVDCNQSKNKYKPFLFQLNSLLFALSYVPLFTLMQCIELIITTITIHSLFLSAYNLFASNTVICYYFHTTIRQMFTATIFKHANCLNARLNELLLSTICSVQSFYSPIYLV